MNKIGRSLMLATLSMAFALASEGATAGTVSYTGNWRVTVKLPPGFGNTGCITLADNGSFGAPHSGPASISGDLGGPGLTGIFQVINNLIAIEIQAPSFSGGLHSVVFVAPASNGIIGSGVYEDPGFEELGFFSGTSLTFGAKNSC
jgi:hypothetical protein